jgi:type I restriction enzyme S subunit
MNGYPCGAIKPLEHYDEGVLSTLYICFAAKEGECAPEFYKHVFESNAFFEELRGVVQVGARAHGLLNVTPSEFLNVSVVCPPLPEQKNIAAILSSVDDAIAATQAVIDQTRKVKEGLLHDLLTRGIGHTRFKQTEIGEIPEGWEVKRLEELATVERGRFSARPRNDPKYYGGDIPFVQTGDVTSSDGFLRKHSQSLNEAGLKVSKLFPKGTILITIAANIGDVALAGYDVAFPDSLVGIIARPQFADTMWLLFALQRCKEVLDAQATQNAQKNINLQVLKPLLLPVPPIEEQRRISSTLNGVVAAIAEGMAKVDRIIAVKRGLMQDLLSGSVRVKGV